ncbi:LysR family transcriptional regulator [Lysobacter sp. S4-A87]|uniref:LysR family transcriptional regulator n=1 Tax=Lysobacter sp. S4-A87 TaxID=2925843 RepID=UPI001F5310D9|nr:LysR family transcriptional regulator [Lysobacter sp. S4-A87]UNK47936.1 LysR family transcriptional regulator [Lysobacter sp. S4-A87]
MSIVPSPQASLDHRDALISSLAASYTGLVAFIAVANEGNFARAADRLGIGRSAVSRSVQRLEVQVGARLFSRTTRNTTITREGEQFYENCRPGLERLLQALEDMRDLREGPPQGHLKISAPIGFGRNVVAPLLADFRRQFPEVTLELLVDDRIVDLSAERIDVAFRDGRLEDSQVVAKKLIPMRMLVCASPDYARRHGLPASVDELSSHACINQRLANGRLQSWDFKVDGHPRTVTPNSTVVVNDPSLATQAVLDGQGLAQLPAYQVCSALRDGMLVACLESVAPDDRGHYLCYLSRYQLPKRVRVFIDFMTARIRALDLEGPLAGLGSDQSLRSADPIAGIGVAA